MAKENEIKIKHHYVSREHLRNWSSDRKNIWYTTKYNKTARDGIAGLAMEKFFYSISEINSEDEEYIKEILKPNFSETVEKKLTPYIDTLILLSKEMTSEKNPNRNKILKNNILENIYTEHENKIKIIQRDICNERKIKSEDIKYTLIIFICVQKSKTKPFKTNVTKKINENNHFINPEKMKYLLEKNWWII